MTAIQTKTVLNIPVQALSMSETLGFIWKVLFRREWNPYALCPFFVICLMANIVKWLSYV